MVMKYENLYESKIKILMPFFHYRDKIKVYVSRGTWFFHSLFFGYVSRGT